MRCWGRECFLSSFRWDRQLSSIMWKPCTVFCCCRSVCQQSLRCPGYFSVELCHLHMVVIHAMALAFNDCAKWFYSHSSEGQFAKLCVFQETERNDEFHLSSWHRFLLQVFWVKGPGLSYLCWLTFHVFQWGKNFLLSHFVLVWFLGFWENFGISSGVASLLAQLPEVLLTSVSSVPFCQLLTLTL